MAEQHARYHIDTTWSRGLARDVEAQARSCYRNAVLAGAFIMHRANPRASAITHARYVEGYIVILGHIPIEHGWLEVEMASSETLILDPTLVLTTTDAELQTVPYFAGLRYPVEEALKRAVEGSLPFFERDNYKLWRTRAFQNAQWYAYRHVGITLPTTPPPTGKDDD